MRRREESVLNASSRVEPGHAANGLRQRPNCAPLAGAANVVPRLSPQSEKLGGGGDIAGVREIAYRVDVAENDVVRIAAKDGRNRAGDAPEHEVRPPPGRFGHVRG